MTRSERRTFWWSHFEAWQAGDQSQAAYCRQHDLSAVTFSWWKCRFEREQLTAAVNNGHDNGFGSLVEVRLADQEPSVASAGVTVELGPQVRLQLARDFDATALQRAVRALTDAGR